MQTSPRVVISLAALSGCDLRTVLRVIRGRPVRDTSLARVRSAAQQLGLDLDALAGRPTVPGGDQ